MVKIQDQISLKGEEIITISEFRAGPGEVLRQVEMGKTFKITKQGKVVAVMHKPEPNAFELGAAARAVEREERRQAATQVQQPPRVDERTLPDPVMPSQTTPVNPTKPFWAT
jgi:prevent-host-death family protein